MQTFICQLVMLSVLVMSAEGATDVATDGVPHGDDLMHQIDATKSCSSDTSSDTDLEGVHCQHCCHGHVVSITPHFLATTAHTAATEFQPGETPHVPNYAQAPPTPPPNA
jgi:hypothetical protein